MTPQGKKWFDEAVQKGIQPLLAYAGTEVIDSWAGFWGYSIPEKSLKEMIDFAVAFPEAALHRWSTIAGPRPWLPDDSTKPFLKDKPQYSWLDTVRDQKIKWP